MAQDSVNGMSARACFVRSHTTVTEPPLVPEVRLHLASAVTSLWHATESDLQRDQLPPPFWAFAWPGGQALARYVLDHGPAIRGAVVFDFAAGCGVAAIAAALAGAARVVASELDPFAVAALALNADLNGVSLAVQDGDSVGDALAGIDVVLAGDVCYERPMADRVAPWLRTLAAAGKTVLLADPGRAYVPRDGLVACATYAVPTTLELEDREERLTTVWRVEA